MMDTALAILDQLGETDAAAHLQQAICVLRGDAPPTSIEEIDRFLDGSEARAFMDRHADNPSQSAG